VVGHYRNSSENDCLPNGEEDDDDDDDRDGKKVATLKAR